MFMAQITQPYHREPNPSIELEGAKQEGGIPVYHDGFAYGGILNIQTIKQKWPATAGIGHEEHTILGTLKLQSQDDETVVESSVPKDEPKVKKIASAKK
mmetsp:Transcript_1986/g.3496  ORF Transcript_1986/g.3496 Transcript_1986/m.3496 type:complete len:99 (+) Transcript_1986:1693-1989(+)